MDEVNHIEKDTVSMYFVRAAVAKLPPPAQLQALAAAGIPAEWLGMAHARVPASAFSALWLAVGRALDDEFFGLDRRGMKVGSYALMCQAVISCTTMERAIKRILRGFAVFLDELAGELVVQGPRAELRLHNRIADAADRRFADETFLVLTHGLLCWLIGRRFVLDEVGFAHPRPEHAAEYTRMFCEHLRFEQPLTAIRFDAELLRAPIVQNAETLQAFLATAPQSVFLRYKNDDSWTARLRRRLRQASIQAGETHWPLLEELAAELGTNPTTLRRRLEAEGTSYQQLKDRLRSDLAIDRLVSSQASIDELALELGFHDASAFHRAFRRWTGLPPGAYRRREQGEPERESR